jgi:exopolysaccharide biosynthesis predicted pyruvyltransferase EpsI
MSKLILFIININFELNSKDILILGVGIGSKFFLLHLNRIKEKHLYKTILWGAGVDSFVDKTKILINKEYDLYGNYFDFINDGNNFEEKLDFLSSCENMVTNTYHGAYWATLLTKKVMVIPYKSGLMSLKHKHDYCWEGDILDKILHSVRAYEAILEQHRKLNLDFYKHLTDR